MTTLIIGGTGFLGGQIARALHEAGEPLRLLVRRPVPAEVLRGVPYEEVRGDLRDVESLRAAVQDVRWVVNAAGSVRMDLLAAARQEQLHVRGTDHLLAALQGAGVERLLHVSSTAAIGSGTLEQPADESKEFDLDWLGAYFRSKHRAEQRVLAAARTGKLEAVVINPSYVVGPEDIKPSSGRVLITVATGLMMGYPSGGMGFVDGRDVGQGAVLALRHGRSGERYILSAENLTWKQFLTIAAEECGVPAPWLPLPRIPLVAFARGAERLGGQRLARLVPGLNYQAFASAFELMYVSSAKAKRELGFAPRPVRQAVRDAYRWFAQAGRLPRRLAPWSKRPAAPELASEPGMPLVH